MLISFHHLVQKYGLPKGIIHVGAHRMEERNDYISSGVNKNIIWIEANPTIYNDIKNTSNLLDSEKIYNYAISDIDDTMYDFYVTNNGQSSSILELDLHKTHHPDIYVTETLKVSSKRMDSLFKQENLSITDYNFINLDIQGAELLALKGFGKLLDNIDYIYTEVNSNYLYKNCTLIQEIDHYLQNFNFKRTETAWTQFEWGDAFYIK